MGAIREDAAYAPCGVCLLPPMRAAIRQISPFTALATAEGENRPPLPPATTAAMLLLPIRPPPSLTIAEVYDEARGHSFIYRRHRTCRQRFRQAPRTATRGFATTNKRASADDSSRSPHEVRCSGSATPNTDAFTMRSHHSAIAGTNTLRPPAPPNRCTLSLKYAIYQLPLHDSLFK